jgi:kynureninase
MVKGTNSPEKIAEAIFIKLCGYASGTTGKHWVEEIAAAMREYRNQAMKAWKAEKPEWMKLKRHLRQEN